MEKFQVKEVFWAEDHKDCAFIREEVFVKEQQVPRELELDGEDPECVHVLARTSGGKAAGTGRMNKNGKIGRVAVLAPWRRRGLGQEIMKTLENAARQGGMNEVYLHAQLPAVPFYTALGYGKKGKPFYEANTLHITMNKKITTGNF